RCPVAPVGKDAPGTGRAPDRTAATLAPLHPVPVAQRRSAPRPRGACDRWRLRRAAAAAARAARAAGRSPWPAALLAARRLGDLCPAAELASAQGQPDRVQAQLLPLRCGAG